MAFSESKNNKNKTDRFVYHPNVCAQFETNVKLQNSTKRIPN